MYTHNYIQFFCTVGLLSILCSCTGNGEGNGGDGDADSTALDSLENLEPELQLYEEAVIPQSVDELFDDFFFNFISDPRFQSQRMYLPLRGIGESASHSISKQEWNETSVFGSQDFYCSFFDKEADIEFMKDTTLTAVSVEWLHTDEDYVMAYNFQRREGHWVLSDYERKALSSTPHADFAQFYHQFVTDTTFQRQAIQQPLPLVTLDAGEESAGGTMELSADDWFEFSKEMPLPSTTMTNINYGQPNTSETHRILLVSSIGSSLFVKYKFERINGEWRLKGIEN